MDKDTTTKPTERNEICRILFNSNRIDFIIHNNYGLSSNVIMELVNAFNIWIKKNQHITIYRTCIIK